MLDRFARSYFFVIGIAVFPVLAMLASNLEGIEISSIWRPLAVSVIMSLAIFGMLRALTENTPKAALLTMFLIISFFSYGHLYTSLKRTGFIDPAQIRHRYILPLVVFGAGLVVWWIARRAPSLTVIPALNLAAVVLVVMPTFQITRFVMESASANRVADTLQECRLSLGEVSDPPDIYLIILDAYERDDILL